jgi:hypothetical protein
VQIETLIRLATNHAPDDQDQEVIRSIKFVFDALTNNTVSKSGWAESNLFAELYKREKITKTQASALILVLAVHMAMVDAPKGLYMRSAREGLDALKGVLYSDYEMAANKSIGVHDELIALLFAKSMFYYLKWKSEFVITKWSNKDQSLRNARAVFDQLNKLRNTISDQSLVALVDGLDYLLCTKDSEKLRVEKMNMLSNHKMNHAENQWALSWKYDALEKRSMATDFRNKASSFNKPKCLFVKCSPNR